MRKNDILNIGKGRELERVTSFLEKWCPGLMSLGVKISDTKVPRSIYKYKYVWAKVELVNEEPWRSHNVVTYISHIKHSKMLC
jgi:hypothetical protein